MNCHQTYLMLEILLATYTTEELENGKKIKRILRRYFQLPAYMAECLIEGALVLKDLRERSARGIAENHIYVH